MATTGHKNAADGFADIHYPMWQKSLKDLQGELTQMMYFALNWWIGRTFMVPFITMSVLNELIPGKAHHFSQFTL